MRGSRLLKSSLSLDICYLNVAAGTISSDKTGEEEGDRKEERKGRGGRKEGDKGRTR